MHPVRRGRRPLTVTALSTALAAAALTPAAAPAATGCAPGAITATTSAQASHQFVCDASHARVEVVQGGGAPLAGTRATSTKRCAVQGRQATARPGRTLVSIVTTVDAAGKPVQYASTAFICGSDAQWHQIADQMAAATRIPTSIVTETTEHTR